MSVRVGIVMDPIAGISYKKDSSLAMLLAAQDRGWTTYVSFKEWYVKLSTIFAIGDTVSDTMHFTPKACASI